MTDPIVSISISDIHLGHGQVSTESLIRGLNKALPDNKEMARIDFIFLVGDVFDSLLNLPDNHIGNIQRWIIRTLKLCVKWDICLRVLEGTPSHDRKQSNQFVILNELYGIGADLLYVDTLHIEFNMKHGVTILYIPDEYRGSNDQTKYEVIELLKENNLSTVDYALMHGCFPHQVPDLLKKVPTHDHVFYLSIVTRYIFIGHFHIMSQYEYILAQGSFGRLTHNEEGDKGYFLVESYRNNRNLDKVTFMVNNLAAYFITMDIRVLTSDDVIQYLNKVIDKVNNNNYMYHIPTFIRIVTSKLKEHEDIINAYKRGNPGIKWSSKIVADSKLPTLGTAPAKYIPIPINENTIMKVMENRLLAQGIPPDVSAGALDVLKSIKGAL